MSAPARTVLHRVAETLQDPTGVRWSTDELVRYLNDGQREIFIHRPDLGTKTDVVTLEAGSRQILPEHAVKLIEVRANAGGKRGAIHVCSQYLLDSVVPNWRSMRPTSEIKNYVFDSEPRVFHVYPPATAGTQVEAVFVGLPDDIAEIGAGEPASSVRGALSVPPIFAGALRDYILFRAYSKDSEHAANAALAQAHYAAFAGALTTEKGKA